MNDVRSRYQRLEPLIDRALELEGSEREKFLDLCGEIHPDLIGELRRALAPDDELPNLGVLAADLTVDRPTDRRGLRAGPWRLLERIGRGGMGTVYLAERADGAFDKRVAIKLLRGEDSRFKKQLERERHMLARLDHPGIARLIDGGVMPDGQPWLVMELADGEDLDVWLTRARPGLLQRLEVFLSVCDAVSYAHGELVVHRDLKPGNIRIASGGSVKLLDFGIAKLLSPDAINASTRHVALTPEFAAPEQLAGRTVTVRTDVYALGTLLYLMLTGRSPHPPFDGNWAAYIEHVTGMDAEPASEMAAKNAKVPVPAARLRGDLNAIVAKALARNPADRYADADALAQDVRAHLSGRAVQARSASLPYRAGKWLYRHRVAAALLSVAVLVSGAVIVWWAWSSHGVAQDSHAQQQTLSRSRQIGQRLARWLRPAATADTAVSAAAPPTRVDAEPAGATRPQMFLNLAGVLLDAGDELAAELLLTQVHVAPGDREFAVVGPQLHVYRAAIADRRGEPQVANTEMRTALALLAAGGEPEMQVLTSAQPALIHYFSNVADRNLAVRHAQLAYDAIAAHMPANHPSRLQLQTVLASLQAAQGMSALAIRNFDAVIDRLEAGGGDALVLLSSALCERGMAGLAGRQQAIADLRRCVALRHESFGDNDWRTHEAVVMHESLSARRTMTDEARRALAGLHAEFGADHPRVRRARSLFEPD